MSTSLASMVGTRADSASRHMLQCRVHKNRLLSWTSNKFDNDELIRHKHKYCLAKDELALEVSNPMSPGSDQYARPSGNPYPLVLSSFHGLSSMPNLIYACLMGKGSDFTQYREEIFKVMSDPAFFSSFLDGGRTLDEEMKTGWDQVKTMPYFRTMGYSVGTAYAHEASGDTMASVMIGGITTALNGAFPMQTGDRVMWYLTDAESSMFDLKGQREVPLITPAQKTDFQDELGNSGERVWPPWENPMMADANGGFPHLTYENVVHYVQHIRGNTDRARKQFRSNSKISKQQFTKQQIGLENMGNTNKKNVALIKPFFYRNASGGDFERVFAVCLSPAAPFEMVDIMISRQSL